MRLPRQDDGAPPQTASQRLRKGGIISLIGGEVESNRLRALTAVVVVASVVAFMWQGLLVGLAVGVALASAIGLYLRLTRRP